jgi:hypothetical protein
LRFAFFPFLALRRQHSLSYFLDPSVDTGKSHTNAAKFPHRWRCQAIANNSLAALCFIVTELKTTVAK